MGRSKGYLNSCEILSNGLVNKNFRALHGGSKKPKFSHFFGQNDPFIVLLTGAVGDVPQTTSPLVLVKIGYYK
jgi:hypothetical protein